MPKKQAAQPIQRNIELPLLNIKTNFCISTSF